MVRMCHSGADMLCRAHHAGIGCVDIEIARAWQFPAYICALEEVDVIEAVDNSGAIIKIDDG